MKSPKKNFKKSFFLAKPLFGSHDEALLLELDVCMSSCRYHLTVFLTLLLLPYHTPPMALCSAGMWHLIDLDLDLNVDRPDPTNPLPQTATVGPVAVADSEGNHEIWETVEADIGVHIRSWSCLDQTPHFHISH